MNEKTLLAQASNLDWETTTANTEITVGLIAWWVLLVQEDNDLLNLDMTGCIDCGL